jgi:hypothetical protein
MQRTFPNTTKADSNSGVRDHFAVRAATFLRRTLSLTGPDKATDAIRNVLAEPRDDVRVPSRHGWVGPAHDAHDRPVGYPEQE